MKTTATFDAAVAICEARNRAVVERDRLFDDRNNLAAMHEAGFVGGFDIALDILAEVAGIPKASVEYIALGGIPAKPEASSELENAGA